MKAFLLTDVRLRAIGRLRCGTQHDAYGAPTWQYLQPGEYIFLFMVMAEAFIFMC